MFNFNFQQMKLGIIGTGKIVEEALPVLKANGHIQLVGICAVNNKEKDSSRA